MTQFEKNSGRVNGPHVGVKLEKTHRDTAHVKRVCLEGTRDRFQFSCRDRVSRCLSRPQEIRTAHCHHNHNNNENNNHNYSHNRCNEEEQLQQKPTHGVSVFLETTRKTIQIQFFHSHVATVSVFVET